MGYIEDGKYKKGKPKVQPLMESSTYKSWDHQVQRDNHRRDMIQPHNQDGTLNKEFIDEYILKNDEIKEAYRFNLPGEDA